MLRKVFSKLSGQSHQQFLNEELVRSIIHGNKLQVKKLLADGANLNAEVHNKACYASSLGCAIFNKNTDIAVMLLERGANPDFTSGICLAPLMLAVRMGNEGVVKKLIEYKADLNIKADGGTALENALCRREEIMSLILIDAGAVFKGKNLFDALYRDHKNAALKMIEKGADFTVCKDNLDVRTLAERGGHTEVVELIDLKIKQRLEHEAREFEEMLRKSVVLQRNLPLPKPPFFKPSL